MEIVRVVGIGMVAVVLLAVLRPVRPELAVLLACAAGAYILFLVLGWIGPVLQLLRELALRANVNFQFLNLILKIIGVAYLAEFGAQVARDAGEGSVAAKIELAGKVIVLALAVPIFAAVMEVVLRMLA